MNNASSSTRPACQKILDGDISETKRAAGDLLVSKQPDFLGFLDSQSIEFLDLEYLDFWIFHLVWDFWRYLGNK